MSSSSRRHVLAAAAAASAGLAGCLSGLTHPEDLGDVEGSWPVDGGTSGHTRSVAAGPADPEHAWTTTPDAARAAGTPTIDSGRIYVPVDAVSERARHRYRLHALDAATGDNVWQVPLRSDPNRSPAVLGTRIVVSARPSLDRGRVVAFGRRYGDEEWLYDIDARVTAPPTISDGTAYVPDWNGIVHAIDVATGELRWANPVGADEGGREFAEPAAVHDGTLYVGSVTGRTGVVAVDARTGADRWTRPTAGVMAGPVVDDDLVVVRAHRLVVAFDPDGTDRWTYNVPADDWRAPALDRRHVYVPAEDRLRAIERDGSKGWSYEADERVGLPTVVGETVIVAVDGELIGLSAADGTTQWTASTEGTGDVIATPDALFMTGPNGRVIAAGSG